MYIKNFPQIHFYAVSAQHVLEVNYLTRGCHPQPSRRIGQPKAKTKTNNRRSTLGDCCHLVCLTRELVRGAVNWEKRKAKVAGEGDARGGAVTAEVKSQRIAAAHRMKAASCLGWTLTMMGFLSTAAAAAARRMFGR